MAALHRAAIPQIILTLKTFRQLMTVFIECIYKTI